jgi:DNA-binding PadR family transcriptional regulator
VKLKPLSYLILGMLRLGATSGYAIKQLADAATRHFWPTSLAQVYPQLGQLHDAGLIDRRADPQGARARDAYELTDRGQTALRAWLRSYRPTNTPPPLRDEGMLRLFFADALPLDEQLTLIRKLRDSFAAAEQHIRNELEVIPHDPEHAALRYPAITARLGSDSYAYIKQWLTALEADLRDEAAHSSAKGR